jgi:hypothetical protein
MIQRVVELFSRMSLVPSKMQFDAILGEITTLSADAASFIREIPAENWANCVFPVARFGRMGSQPVESFNSSIVEIRKEHPLDAVVEMVEHHLEMCYERRKSYEGKPQKFVTWVQNAYDKARGSAAGIQVVQLEESEFLAKGGKNHHIVTVNQSQHAVVCTCGSFEQSQIACKHALAVAHFSHLDDDLLVSPYLTVAEYVLTYAPKCKAVPFVWTELKAAFPSETELGAVTEWKRPS